MVTNSDKQSSPISEWRQALLADRPTYRCPACGEEAMQFHSELNDGSKLREVFRCCACGMVRDL